MDDIIEKNYFHKSVSMTLASYINLFYHKIFELYIFTGDTKLIYYIIYKIPLLYNNVYNDENVYNFLIGDIEIMKSEITKITKVKLGVKQPCKLYPYIKGQIEIDIVCDDHPLTNLVKAIIEQSISIYQKRFLLLLENDTIYEWSKKTKNNYFGNITISDNLITNLFTFSTFVPCSRQYILYYLR